MDTAKPFTRGWRVAIILAFIFSCSGTGVTALRRQEEQHFLNHEKRIDELEKELKELRKPAAPPAKAG